MADRTERHRAFHDSRLATCASERLRHLRLVILCQPELYLFFVQNRHRAGGSKGGRAFRDHAGHVIMQATLARDVAVTLGLVEKHLRETAQMALSKGQFVDQGESAMPV